MDVLTKETLIALHVKRNSDLWKEHRNGWYIVVVPDGVKPCKHGWYNELDEIEEESVWIALQDYRYYTAVGDIMGYHMEWLGGGMYPDYGKLNESGQENA